MNIEKSMFKIWIDEAGRWPWAWVVVACSLCFNKFSMPDSKFLWELNDSKKLTHKKREELFNKIIEFSNIEVPKIYFWVWVVDNFLIDQINIRQANKEAMRRSLVEILRKIPPLNPLISKDGKTIQSKRDDIEVFIDWKDNYIFEELLNKPNFIIWWDSKVLEISAASIVAKVFRDKLMDTYSLLYPNIWFEKHKWYWTKSHIDSISKKEKITWIHRLSYKPVKKILES